MVWILVLLGIGVFAFILKVIPSEAPGKVAEPEDDFLKTDLTEYQLWCAGLDGIMTEICQFNHSRLSFTELGAKELEQFQELLADDWDIHNREDLLAALDWLGGEGGDSAEFLECALFFELNPRTTREDVKQMCEIKRELSFNKYDFVRQCYETVGEKGLLAWDFGRYVFLCRSGYTLGYLDRQEALTLIEEAGMEIKGWFASWADFGENFILGRRFWSCDDPKMEKQSEQEDRKTYYELVGSGAWARIPWEWSRSK